GYAAVALAALAPRHDGHRPRAERPPQAVHVDADDARAAERAVGLDADLMAEERAGVDARILQREGEQRGGHLLAGGDQHVALAVLGRPRRLACEREQAIRLARHRRHDDDELVAGGTCGRDDARHVADAIDVGDRRASELLDDQRHGYRAARDDTWRPPARAGGRI